MALALPSTVFGRRYCQFFRLGITFLTHASEPLIWTVWRHTAVDSIPFSSPLCTANKPLSSFSSETRLWMTVRHIRTMMGLVLTEGTVWKGRDGSSSRPMTASQAECMTAEKEEPIQLVENPPPWICYSEVVLKNDQRRIFAVHSNSKRTRRNDRDTGRRSSQNCLLDGVCKGNRWRFSAHFSRSS